MLFEPGFADQLDELTDPPDSIGANGFSTPTWENNPCQNIGAANSASTWLTTHGLSDDAPFLSDPGKTGVPLLVYCALGLDPRKNPGARHLRI